MFKIDFMKFNVTKAIPVTEDGCGAEVGDVLTVGWYADDDGSWALFKDNEYVCDLMSYYGTHNCEEIEPENNVLNKN